MQHIYLCYLETESHWTYSKLNYSFTIIFRGPKMKMILDSRFLRINIIIIVRCRIVLLIRMSNEREIPFVAYLILIYIESKKT